MSTRLTLSYDWNRGSDENPLPWVRDMPVQHLKHLQVEGDGGGTEEWQYDLDLEFDSMANAKKWIQYIQTSPNYKKANGNITWRK